MELFWVAIERISAKRNQHFYWTKTSISNFTKTNFGLFVKNWKRFGFGISWVSSLWKKVKCNFYNFHLGFINLTLFFLGCWIQYEVDFYLYWRSITFAAFSRRNSFSNFHFLGFHFLDLHFLDLKALNIFCHLLRNETNSATFSLILILTMQLLF